MTEKVSMAPGQGWHAQIEKSKQILRSAPTLRYNAHIIIITIIIIIISSSSSIH